MANHPYNSHREQQVAHRRVGTILSGSPSGAQQHAKGHAFSKITSKSAASRDDDIAGRKSPQRFARGGPVKKAGGGSTPTQPPKPKPILPPAPDYTASGKRGADYLEEMLKGKARGGATGGFARGGRVKKGGGNTNIAIVLPKGGGPAPGGPAAGPLPPPPMAGPGGPPPMGAPPPGMPPGLPPGMPMRASGGRVIDGEATKGDIKKWGRRVKDNSYFRGGAATGVGREEKAAHMKGRK